MRQKKAKKGNQWLVYETMNGKINGVEQTCLSGNKHVLLVVLGGVVERGGGMCYDGDALDSFVECSRNRDIRNNLSECQKLA